MRRSRPLLFIVYLRFGGEKDRAGEFMDQHVEWIRGGIDEGVFLCAGSLADRQGGVVLAYGIARDALERRLAGDPFVLHGVVTVEIVPISVGMMQEKAEFLAG